MSKEYFREDGSRVTVTDDNLVFDSNGLLGQINQFGEFVSENGSKSYRIYGNGNIVGSNGESGNIIHGKYLQTNYSNNENTVGSSYSSNTTISIPLWLKMLLVLVVLPILGGTSMFIVVSLAIFSIVYEELQSGNVIPIIVFFVILFALIVLLVFLIYKVVKLIKKKIK